MITNFFIPELNNHDVQELWFQQDGATCHTARATIDLLKDTFGDRLISRFGPVNWPSRSCDLTPLDYFLWGYVKSLVYADKPQTLDHLEDNIRRVIADIRPQMLEKVLTRVDSCCFKSKFYRKDLIDELQIFGMSSQHHINDFMRGRIIGKIEEGRKITAVAREFDIAHSVVSRLWKSFKTTGMCSRRHGGGRVRTQQLANQFLAASGKQISRKTVARRLRGGGLYARRPVVCVPLTRQHRTARLQWCREHHNWTEQDWECVLFSDESRFSLSSDCRRQLIWRESGTAYRPENIQEKDQYPTGSIMVWAGIMINGRTCLHVVVNGTRTGQRYIDEVLFPHVRLFRGAVGDKFVFMDDNATCHRTLAVQDCLDSEGIQSLVWPARSPDLNPI
ncbi:transposable element Tcb1 transposase [Trichonephila clavipes]|nr:transposable element Tcb1 transposase [Trichonephila clavipes]